MDLDQAIATAKKWAPLSTFRIVSVGDDDEDEIPVTPNYGWTFSTYHPPEIKENPNLEETTELSIGAVVVFHGLVEESWGNVVFCFSLLHAPNSQFFISAGFFENLVPVPVAYNAKRGAYRRYR